ncbi:TPA: restriction endonuclease subunit S [Vibrio parahaemolyticus]
MESITEMPKYESYKDSGIDWIGEIPQSWELRRVKSFLRLIANPAPKNNDYELLSVYTDIGVKPRRELEEKGNKASTTDGYWKVQEGDFIVNKLLAWMGAIGISNYSGVTSPAYDILRPYKEISGVFYHFLFRTKTFASVMKKSSRGIMDMRLRLYFDKFGDIRVPFPPVKEQYLISKFLDKKIAQIDEAITIKEKQINLLQERMQIIVQQAVSKGLESNVTMKNSGVDWLGDIPEHWELKKLKYFSKIKNGIDYKHVESAQGYPVYGSGGQFTYANSYLYRGEAVLLGRKGTIDRPLYVNEAFWTVDTMFYAICDDSVSTKYVYYCATTIPFKFYSTATALPSMTQTDLLNHIVAMPDKNEQLEIVSFLECKNSEFEEAVLVQKMQIDKLKEYKSTLINSAVTGKIKITPEMVED